MSVIVGPTSWWVKSKEGVDYYARACPIGTILGDGSAVYCKAGGLAWIVAPTSTQVSSQWAGGQYNTTFVGTSKQICCICEWPTLCTALLNNGFNPCDWFVPDQTNLFNSANCRAYWDTYTAGLYWGSTEYDATNACRVSFISISQGFAGKTNLGCVRPIRCITT